MLTPLLIDTTGMMADVNHLIGALVLTITVTALAAVTRAVRFLNLALAICLMAAPLMLETDMVQTVSSLASAVALLIFSLPRGYVRNGYGSWDRFIV